MERPISDVASPVNEILAFVRGPAQAMEIGDVERQLLSLVMAVGRAALEAHIPRMVVWVLRSFCCRGLE
jgi:hypothetical protein